MADMIPTILPHCTVRLIVMARDVMKLISTSIKCINRCKYISLWHVTEGKIGVSLLWSSQVHSSLRPSSKLCFRSHGHAHWFPCVFKKLARGKIYTQTGTHITHKSCQLKHALIFTYVIENVILGRNKTKNKWMPIFRYSLVQVHSLVGA